MGYRLILWHAVAEGIDGDQEESHATMGLDFFKP